MMMRRSIEKLFMLKILFFAVFLFMAGILLSTSVLAETTDAQQAPAEETAAAAPAVPGDPGIGRMLFTGEKAFANGGPACISCHSVGIGALGGGTLGPDLMAPNEKYGVGPAPANPLIAAGWINNPATPVMGPVFSKHNVTDEEVDHLKAFFSSIADQPSSSKTGVFVGVSAAGFVGVLIFFGIVWSNRFRNRVGGTAHEAIWRNYGGKGGQR